MRGALLSIVSFAAAALYLSDVAQAQTLSDLYPETAKLVDSGGALTDTFGVAIAIDGNTLVVGIPDDDVGLTLNQGSVRVFVRSGSSWVLQATLTSATGQAGDAFGASVDIDGDSVVVGVPFDSNTNSQQGSVSWFERSGSTWTERITIYAADAANFDNFGSAVAIDGNLLIVGVPGDDVGTAVDRGSARAFRRDSQLSWNSDATLLASSGAAGDKFGSAVTLDGGRAAIGAPLDTVGTNAAQGSVTVFERSISSWSLGSTVVASDGAANDKFGTAVALDGDLLAIGVPFDTVSPNPGQGSIRLFARKFGWFPSATIVEASGGSQAGFGSSVALRDGVLVGGAPLRTINLAPNQGIATVFRNRSTGWVQEAVLESSDAFGGEQFATAVAIGDGFIAASVPFEFGAPGQGSVRVFGSHTVWNATSGVGFPTLVDAIAGSTAGSRLLVGNSAFDALAGVVDSSQKRFNFVALEPLTIPSTTMMTLATNTAFERSPEVVAGELVVAGDLMAPEAGSLVFERLVVASGGQFLQRGATVAVNGDLTTQAGGACYLRGAVLAEGVGTAVGAQNRCAGDTDVFANYTNAGTTIVQRGILYIYGTLVNTGTLTGEVDTSFMPPAPGDGYSIGGDYAVSADSSIVLPDPVWWLRIGGSFDMAINSASRFVMDQATLEMTGVGDSAVQSLEVFARDFGAIDDGFATTNYLVGALRIRAGANVSLEDNHNNAPAKGAEAIYTNELFVPAGATLTTNGYRIYTRAATIAGAVSNPADIIVVPDALPCPADLYVDGIVNAAGLSALLVTWGPCSGSCIADIDGDGQVGASDLSLLLASWGPCAAD